MIRLDIYYDIDDNHNNFDDDDDDNHNNFDDNDVFQLPLKSRTFSAVPLGIDHFLSHQSSIDKPKR